MVEYQEGDGRVVFVGELPECEKFPAGKYAVVEFPSGPPKLPFSVVWNGTPVRIELAQPQESGSSGSAL